MNHVRTRTLPISILPTLAFVLMFFTVFSGSARASSGSPAVDVTVVALMVFIVVLPINIIVYHLVLMLMLADEGHDIRRLMHPKEFMPRGLFTVILATLFGGFFNLMLIAATLFQDVGFRAVFAGLGFLLLYATFYIISKSVHKLWERLAFRTALSMSIFNTLMWTQISLEANLLLALLAVVYPLSIVVAFVFRPWYTDVYKRVTARNCRRCGNDYFRSDPGIWTNTECRF